MVSRDPSLITRLRRLAPVIALTFSGCTCAGSSSSSPAEPAAVVVAATATRPPAAAPPTAVPAAAVNAKRAACQRAIDVLAGSTDDTGALASPEARLLADQIPDLVICGAIRKNTDAPCHTLLAKERSREIDCLSMRSMYHELRTYPNGRGFMFDDLKYAECQASGAGKFCDDFRAALRAGDVARCNALNNYGYLCRAFVTMDVSACSAGAAKGDAPDCEKVIERNVLFGKGLEAIARGGPWRDREFARAAMGAPVACAALAQTAIDVCASSLLPQPGQQTDQGTPGPPVPQINLTPADV